MELDSSSLYEDRLKRLNGQTVKRRCAVEQYGVLLDDILECVPYLGRDLLYLLLCVLDIRCLLSLYKALHNERLEELKRHLFRKSALINLELGSCYDNRTSRIVDTLTEEVLTEASLLTASISESDLSGRLLGPVTTGLPRLPCIHQGVDSLLKHSFLVADNDIGRARLEQILQTVVSADNAAIKIVQVGCRKASAVELYHRTDMRRNYRDDVQYHPLGTVAGLAECLDYLKTLADAPAPSVSRCARELCAKDRQQRAGRD